MSEKQGSYDFTSIENKWQKFWAENETFRTEITDPAQPKYYVLDMFPYPSGAGLHVGHPEGYTATDIISRYKRMKGFNVLHPMGWDAFGLPAEQYAIQTGTHPAVTTAKNCNTFRQQIQNLGMSYDWDREVNTTDPNYYKWTQWIFSRIYDTWYDADLKKGRPVSELPIPSDIEAQGPEVANDAGELDRGRRALARLVRLGAVPGRAQGDEKDSDAPGCCPAFLHCSLPNVLGPGYHFTSLWIQLHNS